MARKISRLSLDLPLLLLLLATWIAAAAAQAASSSSTSSISSSTPSTSSSISSSPLLSSASANVQSSGGASVLTFETRVPLLPTNVITTSLPIATNATDVFAPITQDMIVGEELTYVISGNQYENPEVMCWYPISGSYGVLPRILFYFTILAALLLRHHQWLYAGALVTSLTYSGSAAIQAAMMVWVGQSYGDLDLIPIISILGLSCALTVPLLNWSDTLRNIGRNENDILAGAEDCIKGRHGERREQEFKRTARTIILYWSFLITIGFLCVFVAVVPLILKGVEHGWLASISATAVDMRCTPANGVFNYTLGASNSLGYLFVTQEFISANNCLDPCQQFAGTYSLFRRTSDLTSLTLHEALRNFGIASDKVEKHNDVFIGGFYALGLLLFPYMMIQGIYAATFGRRTPGQARNVVYAFLTRLRFSKARSPLDPAGPTQKWIAKFLAQLSYLWAVFIFMLAIPIVVVTIVAGEIFMFNLPESESPQYIGQWSSWTSVALAIFAAVASQLHEDFVFVLSLSFFKTIWLFCHPSWPYHQYWGGRGEGPLYNAKVKNIFTGEAEEMPDIGIYRRTAGIAFGRSSDRVGTFLRRKIYGTMEGLKGEWLQFFDFWRDPEDSRSNQGRVLRLYATPCQCAWGCSCPKSHVQGKCRHEQGVCSQARANHEPCEHKPACEHTRLCRKTRMRRQRLQALNPERRTIAMVLGPLHAGALQLDVTKTPIPFKSAIAADLTTRATLRDEEGSESDMDEKTASSSAPLATWHAGHHTHRWDQFKRIFGRRSDTLDHGDLRPPMPVSKPSDDSNTTQHSPPILRNQSVGERAVADGEKSQGVVVHAGPVHPLLRDSYMTDDSVDPAIRAPQIFAAHESRRRSMLKDLPDTPRLTRTPHPTPNLDTRSLGSGVSAISPVGLPSGDTPPIHSRSDDVSPEVPSSQATHKDSSGQGTKAVSPVQVEAPSDDEERQYDVARSSTGLTTSFERGIMSRQRRSQAYGPDIPRERSIAALSDSAPIPVYLEEYLDSDAGDSRTEDADTDAEAAASDMPGDRSSVAPSESAPPSEHPAPARLRHIAELVQFLPGPRESSGMFLSPRERHQLLDPPSGASTPPIQLPLLSPPDPDSNTARASHLAQSHRSPHLSLTSMIHTPQRQSIGSFLRPVDAALAATAAASGPTSAPSDPSGPVLEGLARIDEAMKRQRSPRPAGYRSTVDYLQVHRPTTMVYADELVLRKDEFGQYRIVMNGSQVLEDWDDQAEAQMKN